MVMCIAVEAFNRVAGAALEESLRGVISGSSAGAACDSRGYYLYSFRGTVVKHCGGGEVVHVWRCVAFSRGLLLYVTQRISM